MRGRRVGRAAANRLPAPRLASGSARAESCVSGIHGDGSPGNFGAAVSNRESAANGPGWQAQAADDRFHGVFEAKQVSMIGCVEDSEECVRAPADLDRAEVEAYLLVAADAEEVAAPVFRGEQVSAPWAGRAAWVAVVRGTGDAYDQGGHLDVLADGGRRRLGHDEEVRVVAEPCDHGTGCSAHVCEDCCPVAGSGALHGGHVQPELQRVIWLRRRHEVELAGGA